MLQTTSWKGRALLHQHRLLNHHSLRWTNYHLIEVLWCWVLNCLQSQRTVALRLQVGAIALRLRLEVMILRLDPGLLSYSWYWWTVSFRLCPVFLCLAGLIKSKIIRSSLWTLRHCINFDILDLSRTYKLQIIVVFTDNSMCTSNIIIQLFQLRYAIYSWWGWTGGWLLEWIWHIHAWDGSF